MGKRIAFVGGYFVSAFTVFFLLVISLLAVLFNSKELHKTLLAKNTESKAYYQAVPERAGDQTTTVKTEDARVTALQTFFSDYDSPLEPYAREIVEQADSYGLDYRLIPAIAMKESTLCKNAPENSHNCWGYGIYGGKTTFFDDYSDAILTISKGLAERYVAIGLVDPYEIMQKYNPVSNGSWAETVLYVMERISTRL